jgi:hypothetical protein
METAGRWLQTLDLTRALAIFVPLLVFAESLSSSILISPNFAGKSYLLCSPLIWLLAAWIHEAGVVGAADRWRPVVAVSAALFVLAGTGIVASRVVPAKEPWRDVSRTMETLGDCRGASVIMLLNEDPQLTRPHFDNDIAMAMAPHYDRLGIRVIPVLVRDALAGHFPPAALARLRDASAPLRCPVVADWIHKVNMSDVPEIQRAFARARGGAVPLDAISVRSIAAHGPNYANGSAPTVTAVLFELTPGT